MARFSWTSERVAETLHLPTVGVAGRVYVGISTDTRTLKRGELFVALRGATYDGAEFVTAAAEAGAAGAVAERRVAGLSADFEIFVVGDALRALGQLAAARRRALDPTVVAITGTTGKTTTRALMAAALGGDVYASPGNFNNLVGVPLSILGAPEAANTWVLEVASNQPGEIEQLGRIAGPDCAVITSVSEGHLEGLGDLQGVLDEKLALLDTLENGGSALVSDEPEELVRQARRRRPDARTVGFSQAADVQPEAWSTSEDGVAWRWNGVDFRLPGFGAHLVRDALFALAVGDRLGMAPEAMARRLAEVELPPMRGEVRRIGRLTLLVDCYNANPASFRAAIDALDGLAAGRRRAALIGTMLELGERSAVLHERVVGWMVDSGIELIAATGEFAAACARRDIATREGVMVLEELEDAYRELASRLRGDEAVLLKASRGMKFERAVPMFERDFGVDETVSADNG
jgi:UDP-N-acetylmuramoyl-tripeptide--D-alanyl-D-alanine ligase